LCIRLGFSHLLVLGVSHCICNQPLVLMGIHIICCTHGGERTTSKDVVWNVLSVVARNVGFHFLRKQPMSFRPCFTIFVSLNQHY
jgi:hypothetical protein